MISYHIPFAHQEVSFLAVGPVDLRLISAALAAGDVDLAAGDQFKRVGSLATAGQNPH